MVVLSKILIIILGMVFINLIGFLKLRFIYRFKKDNLIITLFWLNLTIVILILILLFEHYL
jgi:hypothetical protein